MENAVRIEQLTVAYQHKPVVWDIDLNVGPNGAGKSTLIKASLGILKPIAGKIFIHGQPYKKQIKKVGYLPQRESVDWDFPTNVLDVVLMGCYGKLGWIRRPGKQERFTALECLERVGMHQLASRQINQLSGGQQQRVFLARALMQDASVYFMDEPLQGVDVATEKSIIQILKQLTAASKTIIVVHHDLQTLAEYFDWVCLMNVRKVASGKVCEVLTEDNIKRAYGVNLTEILKVQNENLAFV
jgi:manganese/zinc/iron transport system ATP- binding protein